MRKLMRILMRILLGIFLVVVLFICTLVFHYREKDDELPRCCQLYIGGDSLAVDADIYIDGKKVGVMEEHIVSGPEPTEEEIKKHREWLQSRGLEPSDPQKPGDIFSVGVDIRIKTGEKKPRLGVYYDVTVPSGEHELMFISKDGKRLKKNIVVMTENYIHVDFEDMEITGAHTKEDIEEDKMLKNKDPAGATSNN